MGSWGQTRGHAVGPGLRRENSGGNRCRFIFRKRSNRRPRKKESTPIFPPANSTDVEPESEIGVDARRIAVNTRREMLKPGAATLMSSPGNTLALTHCPPLPEPETGTQLTGNWDAARTGNWDAARTGNWDAASPEPSVIYSPKGKISQKKLENPAGFWNNVGRNMSSLFQNKGAFE